MVIKFLQLNIWYGEFVDRVIEFIKEKNIDIVNFQEVAGGQLNPKGIDTFKYLTSNLGYRGELAISWKLKNQQDSYFGNAILYKNKFSLINKDIIRLKPFIEVLDSSKIEFLDYQRTVLSLLIKISQKSTFQLINTHLPRGQNSNDSREKLTAGKILYNYVKKIKLPFIISGDFNVDPSSQIISWLQTVGRNLSVENGIVNTLNPRIHKAKKLFPPGLCVDYIIVNKSLNVKDFEVLENKDFSDHLPLYLEFEF